MIFRTLRLKVRPWTLADAEAGLRIYGNPEVTQYLGGTGAPVASLEDQVKKIEGWIERDKDLRDDLGFWAIEEVTSGDVVGSVILRPLPNDTKVEVGWHLGREHWGKGYATEAANGAIVHGFLRVELEEIYAIVQPDNIRSIRVAERLGMEPLGHTTQYHNLDLLSFRIRR